MTYSQINPTKVGGFLLLTALILISGCATTEIINCDNCVSCYSDKPNCCNVYVVCDNQDIWDMRGKIRDFDCECDNYGCEAFPSGRVCEYGLWVKENGSMYYEEGTIHCSEVLGKDRRCGGEC